jgi:hypothetical protein
MRAYRLISLALSAIFAAVGAVFLVAPGIARAFVDALAGRAGMPGMPPGDVESGVFRALAGAYMYVVALLAWKMYRRPSEPAWPAMLAHAKFASAAASFALFVAHQPHGVYLLNGVVDGALGATAVVMRAHADRWKRAGQVAP